MTIQLVLQYKTVIKPDWKLQSTSYLRHFSCCRKKKNPVVGDRNGWQETGWTEASSLRLLRNLCRTQELWLYVFLVPSLSFWRQWGNLMGFLNRKRRGKLSLSTTDWLSCTSNPESGCPWTKMHHFFFRGHLQQRRKLELSLIMVTND